MSAELNIVVIINQADAQSGSYPVQLWNEGKPLAEVRVRIDRQALLLHEHKHSAPEYGMELYDAIFSGSVGRTYQRLVGQAEAGGVVQVQLVIHPAAAELHVLPWERMFHIFGDTEAPLATSAQTPFSRFLVTGTGDQPPVPDRILHLLVAIANPENLPQGLAEIDVAGEVTALADLLAELRGRVVGTVLPGRSGLPAALRKRLEQEGWEVVNEVTSWGNIQRHLPGQHVLHILAHGQFSMKGDDHAYLLLEDEGAGDATRGDLHRVVNQEIVDGLSGVHPLPQLVFLASCNSAKRPEDGADPFVGLAPKLVEKGVPAVVAMQDFVSMDLVHELTLDFYRRLFEHGQVDRALNEARSLLFQPDAFDWALPVLFLQLKDGRLFSSTPTIALRRIFDGFIEDYTKLFAGREDQIGELEAFMSEPDGGYLLVTAPAGLGKTALMANSWPATATHSHITSSPPENPKVWT